MENLIADKFDGITILADKRDKTTKLTDQLDLAICEKEDYSRELKLCGYRANEVSSNAILGRKKFIKIFVEKNSFFSFYFSQSVLWILKETIFLFAELFHGFLFKTLLVNAWLFIIYS